MELETEGLALRYEYRDDDETGVLTVHVRFGGFAGHSRAWFSDGDLLQFADRLLTYPLGDERFQISGGYQNDDGRTEEHVGLTVRAVGYRGRVGMLVHLATPPDHADVEHGAPLGEVRLELTTSYEALRRFAQEIRRLVEGKLEAADLNPH